MILPADYKAPLEDDEAEYEEYVSSSDFSDSEPSDYIPYTPSSSSTSRPSSDREPLLANPEDLEWGPVPPYTPRAALDAGHDEGTDVSTSLAVSHPEGKRRRRRRWLRWLGTAAIGYLAVLGCLSLIFGIRLRARGGWRGRFGGPGGPFEREGMGMARPAGLLGGNRPAGETVRQCAQYASGEDWVPTSTTTAAGGRSSSWTNNQTFLLPTNVDLFAYISGDHPFADVVVNTFEADGNESEGAITAVQNVNNGEYAKVVVESIISASDGVEAGGVVDSEGWRILKASEVCLVERSGDYHHPHRRHDQHHAHPPAILPGLDHSRAATGISILTRRPDSLPESSPIPDPNPNAPSLSFVIHVFLPRTMADAPDANTGLAGLLGLRTRRSLTPPKQHIRSLEISAGVGGITVNAPETSVGVLQLRSAMGAVELAETKAERIEVRANGDVRGSVAISEVLDVGTTIGAVDIDIMLSAAPPHAPPSFSTKHSRPQPFSVTVKADTGSVDARYVAWEDLLRPLHSDIQAVVGNVTVENHAAFQGHFELSTTVGNVDTEEREVEDPAGNGRARIIKTDKHGGVTGGMWEGSIQWVQGSADSNGDREEAVERSDRFVKARRNDRDEQRGLFCARATTGDVQVVW